MRSLLIQLLLRLVCHTSTVAGKFDSSCISACDFPGMICVNSRCKCNRAESLFWTGARCLQCPSSWTMSETACIGFYGTASTQPEALATCAQMEGSLITLRDDTIVSLIYEATKSSSARRKRHTHPVDATVGWVGGTALHLDGLGMYAWNDVTVPKFDSKDRWWCKTDTKDLGYIHTYEEPTRMLIGGEHEKCILYRRGRTDIEVLCLDDVLCSKSYPFICERSESTAQLFPGPEGTSLPVQSSAISETTTPDLSTTEIEQTGAETSSSNIGAGNAFAKPAASKSDGNNKLVVLVVIGLLLVMATIAVSLFMVRRHRLANSGVTRVDSGMSGEQTAKGKTRPSAMTRSSDVRSQHSSAPSSQSSLDRPAAPDNFNVNLIQQNQQKNKPGGFSSQRFNEFDL